MEPVSCGETIGKSEKICVDCKTSKTPLWRSGPAGPKSLCNACGIRYRKKRSVVGSDKKASPTSSSSSTTAAGGTLTAGNRETGEDACGVGISKRKNGDLSKKLRIKLVALGKEVVLMQRQRSPMKKIKRQKIHNQNHYKKLGEVEQAAFLLMSLSCGCVFA